MNKPAAIEWLSHSYHDLNGSTVLYNAEHYTDTISYILHQSIEKTLKSLLVFNNKPIKKTHNLVELYELVASDKFVLDEDEMMILSIATTYHSKQRYPTVHKKMPPREEIKQVLDFADELFIRVCNLLEIDPEEVKY